jgi:hypothetical protein
MKININDKVNITSKITTDLAVVAAWKVITTASAIDINAVAITASNRTFKANESSSGILFPFATLPNVFSFGANYVFRLTCSLRDSPTISSSVDVSVLINSPPTSGVLLVSPLSGEALTTAFTLSASGWTDDPTDLPLSYTFGYSLAVAGNFLVVASKSTKAYATSNFPAGDPSLDSALYPAVAVYDTFGAVSTFAGVVSVTASSGLNVTDFLQNALTVAAESFDVDLTLQVANNVASAINTGDCSMSPDCVSLNRNNCSALSGQNNVCLDCLDGFVGLASGNTSCFNVTTHLERVSYVDLGAPCLDDGDCPYFLCDVPSGSCLVPSQSCPSAIPELDCSGSGDCVYKDISGRVLSDCLVTDPYCTASCSCWNSTGGSDCSLMPEQLAANADNRRMMCKALLAAIEVQDPDFHLIETLTSSLAAVFDPSQLTDVQQLTTCLYLLSNVTGLAAQGFFNGASSTTTNNIADIISKFAGSVSVFSTSNTNTNSNHTASSAPTSAPTSGPSNTTGIAQTISDSLAGFTKGIISSTVTGQAPLEIVSSNMRMAIHNTFPSELHRAVLSAPRMRGGVGRNNSQSGQRPEPGLRLPPGGLQACGIAPNDPAQLSMVSSRCTAFVDVGD